MRFAPKLELGYVFLHEDGELMPGSLEKISRITRVLASEMPKIHQSTFRMEARFDSRVNTGLFEYMPFASFPKVEFEASPQEGYFLREPFLNQSFGAFIVGFCPLDRDLKINLNPSEEDLRQARREDEQFEEDILGAARYLTAATGMPDLFTYRIGETSKIAKEFARYLLPQVENAGAKLIDLSNKYAAVVDGKCDVHMEHGRESILAD